VSIVFALFILIYILFLLFACIFCENSIRVQMCVVAEVFNCQTRQVHDTHPKPDGYGYEFLPATSLLMGV
jgi:hypothetical protein